MSKSNIFPPTLLVGSRRCSRAQFPIEASTIYPHTSPYPPSNSNGRVCPQLHLTPPHSNLCISCRGVSLFPKTFKSGNSWERQDIKLSYRAVGCFALSGGRSAFSFPIFSLLTDLCFGGSEIRWLRRLSTSHFSFGVVFGENGRAERAHSGERMVYMETGQVGSLPTLNVRRCGYRCFDIWLLLSPAEYQCRSYLYRF